MKDALLSAIGFLPNWYITACLLTGLVILPIMAFISCRPLLRGLSYGLWETVIFYKVGVSYWRVFKRLMKAVFINFPFWGLLNSTTSSITNNAGGWYGIFSWRLEKSFTRARSIRESKEAKEKANNPEPVETDDTEVGTTDDGYYDDDFFNFDTDNDK